MARRSFRKINNTILPYILILPSMFMLSICICGIISCIMQSFGIIDSLGLNKIDFTYLINTINNKQFIKGLLYTSYIAFIQSLISVVIGFLIASYLILKNKNNIDMLYVPLAVPHIVVAMTTILIFAKNGIISRLFCSIGILDNMNSMPNILYNNIGIGIIISYVWKSTAYVLNVIYILVKKFKTKYYDVSKNIGINNLRFIFQILLPNIKFHLVSIFLILFAFSFGSYEIPYLLSMTSNKTIPIYAYEKYLLPDMTMRPISQSYNLVMIICGIIIMIIYYKLIDKLSN